MESGTPRALLARMHIASRIDRPDRTLARPYAGRALRDAPSGTHARMTIGDMLAPEAIVAELAGRRPDVILAELSRAIRLPVRHDRVLTALLEREERGSTGIGNGLAIPHARLDGLSRFTAVFGRSPSGVDFGAVDARPCHFFFVLLVPQQNVGMEMVGVQIGGAQVRALARICALFDDAPFRESILRAADAAEIHGLIARRDEAIRVYPRPCERR